MSATARARLANYYKRTADEYEAAHVRPGDEHFVALEYMLGLFTTLRVKSVLDVGCGTGRAVRFFLGRRPDLRVVGMEPVDALRQKAAESGVGEYIQGSGEELHFLDGAFDAVIATGIMHHLPDAAPVVREMARVAKRAVMISDTNRFGSGGIPARLLKATAFKLGAGRLFIAAKTRGRGYVELPGDGLHYPYSVYDQLRLLSGWGDRVFLIPTTDPPPTGWLGPLINNSHVLLVAAREPDATEGWAGSAERTHRDEFLPEVAGG